MATNTSLSNSTSNATVCSTPECTTLANAILADLDFNVDPCSDFYQYTCKLGFGLARYTTNPIFLI